MEIRPRIAPEIAEDVRQFGERVTHDLLAPLNQAASLTSLFVKRNGLAENPESAILLGHLEASVRRMTSRASGVRLYLETLGATPVPGPLPLIEAVRMALLLLDRKVTECGARIECGELPEVVADSALMVRLFEEVIENALTFRSGAPEIRIRAEAAGDEHVVLVEDNGPGIPEEFQETVFQPFRRLSGEGCGMGLTIARLVARLHRGEISLRPGAGTIVEVRLPAK